MRRGKGVPRKRNKSWQGAMKRKRFTSGGAKTVYAPKEKRERT